MNTLLSLIKTPVPRDLSLPLPLNPDDLAIILVVLFLVHIFFVNLMMGGVILSVIFEIVGKYRKEYDQLAYRISETVTANKSLAVVLGVGPLLCISLLYTMHFYAANALTGYAWISVIPLVIIAFLVTYLHKYTWHKWTGPDKNRHIALGVGAVFVFMGIPMIFLANINLMLFPDKWPEIQGFFSSLEVGNVFPRYFHFLMASLALTGLFLAGWFGRKKYALEKNLPGCNRGSVRRIFYRITFYATIAQLAFGPLVFATLPIGGVTTDLFILISLGVAVALLLLALLRLEIRSGDEHIGRHYAWIGLLFTVLVLVMGTGRHMYRESSLMTHKALIADKTVRFKSVEAATQMRLAAGLGTGDALASGPTGKSLFANCAACHAVDKVLAAPSLREVYGIYKDNPQGIIAWAKEPGKKRPEFTPMPSFAHLGDENLQMVADYILQLGAPAAETESSDTPAKL
ncbi:MAG: cytochrome c [candidate division Zixibacteria bacterium]|nr:cytochrome c [candidate division Zixibacteria bacterium]